MGSWFFNRQPSEVRERTISAPRLQTFGLIVKMELGFLSAAAAAVAVPAVVARSA